MVYPISHNLRALQYASDDLRLCAIYADVTDYILHDPLPIHARITHMTRGTYPSLRAIYAHHLKLFETVMDFKGLSFLVIEQSLIKQERIHGNTVADGWAGAVMQKPLAI